jgi:hypothetical protein
MNDEQEKKYWGSLPDIITGIGLVAVLVILLKFIFSQLQ